MKLSILKGIGNDLASHLDSQIWYSYFKDIPTKIDVNILDQKEGLSKMCVSFLKERIPTSFDFKKIKEINLKISKSSDTLKISIKTKVDDKEFTSYLLSRLN